MGTYTELLLKCNLKSNIPKKSLDILNYLFNQSMVIKELVPTDLPDHEFFKCSNWTSIGRSCSHYHVPQTFCYFDGSLLFTRFDLKNYDNEIQKFLNWLDQYMDYTEKTMVGWIFCEECPEPLIVFHIPPELRKPECLNLEKKIQDVEQRFKDCVSSAYGS